MFCSFQFNKRKYKNDWLVDFSAERWNCWWHYSSWIYRWRLKLGPDGKTEKRERSQNWARNGENWTLCGRTSIFQEFKTRRPPEVLWPAKGHSELLQIKARGNSVQNLNETTVQKRQIVNRNLRNNYKRRNQKFLLGALIVFNGACILPISLLLCALRLAKGIKDIWFIALESQLSQEICNLWSVLPSRHGLLLVPNWPSQKITPFMLKVFISWQIWKLVLCQC